MYVSVVDGSPISPSVVRKDALDTASPSSLSPLAPLDSTEEATEAEERCDRESVGTLTSPADLCFFNLSPFIILVLRFDDFSVSELRRRKDPLVLTTRTNPPLIVASLLGSTRVPPSMSVDSDCMDTFTELFLAERAVFVMLQ